MRQKQYLMLIGAMKCGTSSLFEYLKAHPAICASRYKEPEFFSEHQGHRIDVADYDELWPDFDPDVHRYKMEASTGYTKQPVERDVAERIAASGIQPKLIYIVRDPVERIESHYNFIANTTAQNIKLDDDYLLQLSRYQYQLQPFIEQFGKDNILVLDFAELCQSPSSVVSRVYRFLSLPPHEQSDYGVHNDVSSASAGPVKRWLRSQGWFRRLVLSVPGWLKQPLKGLEQSVQTQRLIQKERMSPQQRQWVIEQVAIELDFLEQEFGVKTSNWPSYRQKHPL